jgi:uracil-DNA glycosylase
MTVSPSDGNSMDITRLLPWLVDMGADEVLLDHPVDRFVLLPPVSPEPAKIRSVTSSTLTPNWKAVAAGTEGLAAAEALATSITSLDLFAKALDSFDVHPLRKTAGNTCAMGGNLEADILVFCDKPRTEEERSGEVLAGDNQLLASRMLAAIGLSVFSENDTVAISNFIPWRPPGNRLPTDQEAQMLEPFARKLVALLRPKAILCFGHLPSQYLGGGEDATVKARGKWVEIEGIPALTTFHPETLLKSPASKRLAWLDLQAFRQKLDTMA